MTENEAEQIKAKLIRYNDLNIAIDEIQANLDLLKRDDFTTDSSRARLVKSVTIEIRSGHSTHTLSFNRFHLEASDIKHDLENRLNGILLALVNEKVAL